MRLGEVVALLKRLLDLWFGLRAPVGPLVYALSGFGLMIVKYGIEAVAIHHFTGRLYSPRDFLNPLLSVRQTYLAQPAPEWLGWALLLMSIPFLWVA
ncbi:MAG: hypothetical protein RI963_3751, partial [Planctomycetota bacterium]